jgi:hypothetical protein
MPTIGADCDIVLVNPDVNDGNPYGFVLSPDTSNKSSSLSIQREHNEDDDEIQIYIFFTILLADQLKNPDGSMHSESREDMYTMLLKYLAQPEGTSIGTFMGTWLGVGPMGHSATELHLVDGSYISCKLTNVSAYHPPVDSEMFFNSEWQDDTPGNSALTWDTSLWR